MRLAHLTGTVAWDNLVCVLGSISMGIESSQTPCAPLASCVSSPPLHSLTTWAQVAAEQQIRGGHSMLATHRATRHQGCLATASLCVYEESREDSQPPGPSQGGYEVPGPERDDSGFSGSL